MNDYTIRICDIMESFSVPIFQDNPFQFLGIDDIIENGKEKFFSFSFPWYSSDNTGLDEFKELFIRKNYMESIGQENFTQFQLVLQSKLMEIMPKYKQLYETTLIKFNPLQNRNIEYTKTEEGSGNGNTTGSSKTSANTSGTNETNTQNVHSENPEITAANSNFASSMDRGLDKTQESSNTSANGSTESNSTSSYKNSTSEKRIGFEGESPTDEIIKYRNSILNINKMICDELHDVCFLHYYGGMTSHNLPFDVS